MHISANTAERAPEQGPLMPPPDSPATPNAEGVDDPDGALLIRFAAGDPEAAAVLTARLAPRALGVALRVLGNRAEAEDITQEAMVRLWRQAEHWEPGRARLSTWLYRVVMNLCIDHKRRLRGGHVDLDAIPDPPDPAKSAAEQMQDGARQDALQDALMQLPERQRQAVVLRHIEDLANPEIAGIMDISVEAVESLTARGKRALAAILVGRRAELGYSDG
ncbi:RNA polymerase sigma subunit ECF family protein [Phaeobacter inhibens]|nr:RNA polymerase sigma subunit ECF family protein [Phaeobacter inhibens]